MSLVTDKPEDLASTNELDNVEDPDEYDDSGRTEIHLSGATVAYLADPPEMGGRITMLVELEVYDVGVSSQDGGQTITPYRKCRRIGDMWPQGEPRPAPRKSKKQEEAEAKAAAAAAAKGKGLYDDPNAPALPGMPGAPDSEGDAAEDRPDGWEYDKPEGQADTDSEDAADD